MKEYQPINLMDGASVPTLCKHCGNMYSEGCYEQCQRRGDFSRFMPRTLGEREPIPKFPKELFEHELDTGEREALVATYMSWIVTELNRLKKR